MKSVRPFVSLLPLFLVPACGTVHDWRELKSVPMTLGDCYDSVVFVAQNQGLVPDVAVCDRGLGIWQSRWRGRLKDTFGHPARYRLRAEVLLDEGSARQGWTIRYAFEQQVVKDLRHAQDPQEEHWSDDGQDKEAEVIFGERLVRRLSPKG